MEVRIGLLLLAGFAAGCSSTPTQSLGERTFETHCAACHGSLAEGDGPRAASLNVPVPNLRTLSRRNGGSFPTDAVASYIDGRSVPAAHGTREMPVWGPVFSVTQELVKGAESPEQRIADVIAYLRTLQQ
jgi:mono/diheme cytochrome c family protein